MRERKALRIVPRFLTSAIRVGKAASTDVRGKFSSDLDILSLRCLLDIYSISDPLASYSAPVAIPNIPQAITTRQCFASCSGPYKMEVSEFGGGE